MNLQKLQSSPLDKGISIITLGVKDVCSSVAFYQALGWQYSEDSDPGMCTFIKTPSMVIGLVAYEFLAEDMGVNLDPKQNYSGFTLAINGKDADEVDEIFNRAIEAGARAHEKPRWKDWGGYDGYSGYFEDPDGYYWEIAYAPFLKLTQTGVLDPK